MKKSKRTDVVTQTVSKEGHRVTTLSSSHSGHFVKLTVILPPPIAKPKTNWWYTTFISRKAGSHI